MSCEVYAPLSFTRRPQAPSAMQWLLWQDFPGPADAPIYMFRVLKNQRGEELGRPGSLLQLLVLLKRRGMETIASWRPPHSSVTGIPKRRQCSLMMALSWPSVVWCSLWKALYRVPICSRSISLLRTLYHYAVKTVRKKKHLSDLTILCRRVWEKQFRAMMLSSEVQLVRFPYFTVLLGHKSFVSSAYLIRLSLVNHKRELPSTDRAAYTLLCNCPLQPLQGIILALRHRSVVFWRATSKDDVRTSCPVCGVLVSSWNWKRIINRNTQTHTQTCINTKNNNKSIDTVSLKLAFSSRVVPPLRHSLQIGSQRELRGNTEVPLTELVENRATPRYSILSYWNTSQVRPWWWWWH